MADQIITCPHCGQQMTVQEEWGGMVLECPNCQNSLTCPVFSSPPGKSSAPKPPTSGGRAGFNWKAALLILAVAGGFFAFQSWMEAREREKHIHKEITDLFASADFIYGGAQVADIKRQKDKTLYMVTFRRDGRTYQRPVRYREQSGSYEVSLDFKYADRQDYLLEDAGLFWKNIQKDTPGLAPYRLTGVKVRSAGTLCCTLTDGQETVKADLRVSEKTAFSFNPLNQNNTRIEYSLAPVTAIKELFASSDFLYGGARVTEIQMQKEEDRFMVTFLRNGKACRRPVRFRETFDWKNIDLNADLNARPGARKKEKPKEGHYELDFKYAEHQDYLLEDADMFWEELKKSNSQLAPYRLTDVKPRSAGVVRLTITDGRETVKADLQVSEKSKLGDLLNQGGTQIEYRLTPVE